MSDVIQNTQEHIASILTDQLARVERLKQEADWIDYDNLDPLIIGSCWGDGIGPIICKEAERVIRFLLKDEVDAGKIVFKDIDGLTIERRAEVKKAIPDDVLEELKSCHIILKGPTTTPEKGDKWPNIESANVAMRKELDLFANVRPVKVPADDIDWTFFRENTEDMYALGSRGLMVTDDLALDFKVITRPGSERIIRMGFEYAKNNGIDYVTIVTKANVVKTTDGLFLETAAKVAEDYPDIKWDGWYIDIMTAKLVDPKRRSQFKVMILPNLYGDILTDEAAEFQGGVGTAGAANIGKRYAMFEAIHGSAPRMMDEGRGQYADPSSMLRAAAMCLRHIGRNDEASRLEMALDICGQYEKKISITGRDTGCTAEEFGNYVMETVSSADLQEKWDSCVGAAV